MKKTMARVLVAGAAAFCIALAGCGNAQQSSSSASETAQQEQSATSEAQATNDAQSSSSTDDAADTATEAEASDVSSSVAGDPESMAAEPEHISEIDAKWAALSDAGVSEGDVTNLVVKLETDDGVTKYDVDFHVGKTEYSYDIDPVTGTVLKKTSEVDD